jgi:uncharacterized protein (DUF362 family)
MTSLFDTVVGFYHLFGDRVPKNIPLVDPKPRTVNPWRSNGQVLVARVMADGDVRASIDRAITLLGHLEQAIGRGDRVLVKPNFNSPDPYPGSTDLVFLRAVLELLLAAGAKVTIGESSGGIWRPTKNVLRKLGVSELARHLDVELVAFEDKADDWVRIKVNGYYLDTVTVPRSAYEADKIVYLPCMKTHKFARFSGALKLGVGFVHPGERLALHFGNLEQKVAEINLVWQPDLIIMDGRKSFVSGGPEKGELVEPGVIMASGDLVAIDVEALNTLASYKAKNRLLPNPYDSPQIATALRHNLGSKEYKLIS